MELLKSPFFKYHLKFKIFSRYLTLNEVSNNTLTKLHFSLLGLRKNPHPWHPTESSVYSEGNNDGTEYGNRRGPRGNGHACVQCTKA